MRYAVVYERADDSNWSTYVADLPGCLSASVIFEETERKVQEALLGHVRVMREYGDPIPEAATVVGTVEVA